MDKFRGGRYRNGRYVKSYLDSRERWVVCFVYRIFSLISRKVGEEIDGNFYYLIVY